MNLFHYCSGSAFLSIIESKSVWASQVTLSNDRLEGLWLRGIVEKMCNDEKLYGSQRDALLSHIDGMLDWFGAAAFCMSEEGDVLSQWRGYADDGAGFSLGFSSEYLEKLRAVRLNRNDPFGFTVANVIYNEEAQRREIECHVKQAIELARKGAGRSLLLMDMGEEEKQADRDKITKDMIYHLLFLLPQIYRFKNPAFVEEREWRIVSSTISPNWANQPRSNLSGLDLSAMDFRSNGDRLIPYRKIDLEILDEPPITEVIIGPRNITPPSLVRAALKRYGLPDVQVKLSAASYRR